MTAICPKTDWWMQVAGWWGGGVNPWWDGNRDGIFTISDVGWVFRWVFHAPGDSIVALLMGTGVGNFFELDCSNMGGWLSGFISIVVWFFAVFFLFWMLFFLLAIPLTAREAVQSIRSINWAAVWDAIQFWALGAAIIAIVAFVLFAL